MSTIQAITTMAEILIRLRPLLNQLALHHESQAKGAPQCSREYHRRLAHEIRQCLR